MSGFLEWWYADAQDDYDRRKLAAAAWHEARKQAFREATAEIKRYERETYDPVTPSAMVCSRVRSKVASLEQRESDRTTHEDKESIREEMDNE